MLSSSNIVMGDNVIIINNVTASEIRTVYEQS